MAPSTLNAQTVNQSVCANRTEIFLILRLHRLMFLFSFGMNSQCNSFAISIL